MSAILVLAIEVTGAVTDAGREGQIVVGAVTGVVVVVRRLVAIVITRVLTVVVRRVVAIVVTRVLIVVVRRVVAIVVT